ncbi:unnamed protein product [Pylaiella littoralis]
MSRMSESTIQNSFHKFNKFFATEFYHSHVHLPTAGKDKEQVGDEALGSPGIHWSDRIDRCPPHQVGGLLVFVGEAEAVHIRGRRASRPSPSRRSWITLDVSCLRPRALAVR